jgi:uncharacterized OB-fold protein
MTDTKARALPGEFISITTDTCTEPFWQAAKEQRLVAPRCGDCGTFRMPPRPYCPECQSQTVDWVQLPGTATVYSFAICTRGPYPGTEDYLYIPAVLDLDDAPGARLVTNVIDVRADDVHIGMKVSVEWNPIKDGWVLPIFRPVS